MSAGRNPELGEMAEGANEGHTDVLLGREKVGEKVRGERRAVALKHPDDDAKLGEGVTVEVLDTTRQRCS